MNSIKKIYYQYFLFEVGSHSEEKPPTPGKAVKLSAGRKKNNSRSESESRDPEQIAQVSSSTSLLFPTPETVRNFEMI